MKASLIWRTLFGALLLFEICVGLKLFPIQPTFTVIGLIITLVAVWIAVEYTEKLMRRSSVHDHHSITMAILIPLTVYIDAIGDFCHLYTILPNYDAYLHFFIPSVVTIWIWHVLRALYPTLSNRFYSFMAVAIMLAAGALYEIEEYLEDVYTGSHRFGDAMDTGNDLTMDLLGPIIAIICLNIFLKIRKQYNNNRQQKK
ncbi:MAG: hypothetical protein KIH62_001710 [Candidatus Kerfeldbacteria bacterium]|nr:hypothetical protein [Candidatus Kerfeldbacteria bacterium]